MEGWVGLVGWPTADNLPTKWSHVNHRSAKVRQPKTAMILTTEPRHLCSTMSGVSHISPSSSLRSRPLLPSPSFPFQFPLLPLLYRLSSLFLKYALTIQLVSAVISPRGVWGWAPAEIEFGAFQLKNMPSGGSNFNDFHKNHKCW